MLVYNFGSGGLSFRTGIIGRDERKAKGQGTKERQDSFEACAHLNFRTLTGGPEPLLSHSTTSPSARK